MTKAEFKAAVAEANATLPALGEWLATKCSRPFVGLVLIRLADRVLTDQVAVDSQITPEQINELLAAMTVEKVGVH